MSAASRPEPEVILRDLRPEDFDAVVRIDSAHTGRLSGEYWKGILDRFLDGRRAPTRVGLAALEGGVLVGYLLGEVRAIEFGSEPCGWVFAVGVDSGHLRAGVASCLLAEARGRFHDAGIDRLRTMVRRNDVPMLSFFRSAGFVGGSFVQLETELEEARG